jgi:thiol-disulfide isomerase/thioredoxin
MKKLMAILAVTISFVSWAQEQVKFTVNIQNKKADVISIKNNMGKDIQQIKANDKGIFEATFGVAEGMYYLFDGQEYASIYLKNGYDLTAKLDANQFDESLSFSGKGASENNYLADKTRTAAQFEERFMKLTSDAEVDHFCENEKNNGYKKLESGNYDAKFVSLSKLMLVQELTQLKKYFKETKEKSKMNGSPAPGFEYVDTTGKKVKLDDFKGKYVYIDIWATWCGPCRAEIPYLKKAEEKYHGKNLAFVSISIDVDKDFEKWQKFVAEKQLGGTQLFADKNWESDFMKHFGVNSIPRFLLIDPQGKVVYADAKRPSDPKLGEILDGLLK